MDSFPICEGKFVSGKGENTYQEVIDDFKNASFIGIVTFNISSKENGTLISALQSACKAGVSTTVVTNIPKRFKTYYGTRYALSASEVIRQYIRILDAQKFGMRISAYFDFSNHAKIIMTNNVVYCGSANYSDESSGNYECGVISRDAELIQYIRNSVLPEIISESIPYYKYNIAEAIANVREASEFCERARETVFSAAYTEWSDYDTNFQPKVLYRTNDSGISAKLLQGIMDRFSDFEEALSVVKDVVDYYYEKYEDDVPEIVGKLETIYDDYRNDFESMQENIQSLCYDLEQLAHYDWDDEVSRIISDDYGMEAFDENLDHYVDLAMDEANYAYESLIESAEPTIKEIIESLELMKDYYKEMHDTLYEILQLNDGIDNTGVTVEVRRG